MYEAANVCALIVWSVLCFESNQHSIFDRCALVGADVSIALSAMIDFAFDGAQTVATLMSHYYWFRQVFIT